MSPDGFILLAMIFLFASGYAVRVMHERWRAFEAREARWRQVVSQTTWWDGEVRR